MRPKIANVVLFLPFLAACEAQQVDAIYYPDKRDLAKSEIVEDVLNVDDCRRIVRAAASKNGDPKFERGDYECGIGPTRKNVGHVTVYSETTK
jgi:hypothetical protein